MILFICSGWKWVINSADGDREREICFTRKLMDGRSPKLFMAAVKWSFTAFARERRRHEKWLKDTLHIRSHNIALISENINHSAAPFSIWRSQQEFVSIRHFAPFIFVWPDFCVCVVCVVFLLRRPKRQNKWFTFIPIIITERLGTTHKIAKAKLPLGLPREHNNKQEKREYMEVVHTNSSKDHELNNYAQINLWRSGPSHILGVFCWRCALKWAKDDFIVWPIAGEWGSLTHWGDFCILTQKDSGFYIKILSILSLHKSVTFVMIFLLFWYKIREI